MASEGLLAPTSHFAAAAPPQSMHYPSVADLEVAGERLAACAPRCRTCLSCRTAGLQAGRCLTLLMECTAWLAVFCGAILACVCEQGRSWCWKQRPQGA